MKAVARLVLALWALLLLPNVPIPAAADKIDGAGRFLVPALVDVYRSMGSHCVVRRCQRVTARGVSCGLEQAQPRQA